LTVELLAEYLQRALMPVFAGELGTTAEAVEERLPCIFKRASRWKAVILLDEVDVLLEQRSVQDIHRNALVCVFLRTLEYVLLWWGGYPPPSLDRLTYGT
jgi:hypothetical protein